MNNGWVKLHRQILENEFLQQDNNAYIVFTKLLLLANKKNGRYTTGRYKLAENMNLNPSTARHALDRLCKEGLVATETDSKKTVITICKWNKYQQTKATSEASERPAKGQPEATKQELRIKNKEIVSKDTMVTPIYGKVEINDMFDLWEKIIGYGINSNVAKNRNACNNLVKKYSKAEMEKILKAVDLSQKDKYSNVHISDFIELQRNFDKLKAWNKRTLTQDKKGITVIS